MIRALLLITLALAQWSCNFESKSSVIEGATLQEVLTPKYALGFKAHRTGNGLVILTVSSPWPQASAPLKYALIPEELENPNLGDTQYDGIIQLPIHRMVLSSTTHIPGLEALNALDKLVGFPGLDYISSTAARRRIAEGKIAELGANEQLNIEKTVELDPDVLIGFGISGVPRSYQTLNAANIPVIYNGDWMEQHPLGKAEWIKFFGLLCNKTAQADSLFLEIETAYLEAQKLAASASIKPTVLSGALYRDIWYMPGGKSWGASFLRDAHTDYLWESTPETGSLSLSLEAVLEQAHNADFWIAPSEYTSYRAMQDANTHYEQFKPFRDKKIFTYATTIGPTGGILYFELGPARPDLVLKDLIFYLHPGLLTNYKPVFFKPLQ